MELQFSISAEDLTAAIYHTMDRAEILEMIKSVDEYMQDWGFTEDLYKHFRKLHKTYKEELNG